MTRDNHLIRNLRLIASSRKFSAQRRLATIDYLASKIDTLYFLEPTAKEYVEPPARAKALIIRLLKRLLKEDKKMAAVLDRLVFLQGQDVYGLYAAIGDPLHPVKKPTTQTEMSVAVAEVLARLGG